MDWGYNEVLNLLDTFAAWNRCFTVQEVADWAADPVNLGQLRHSFSQDVRFVRLSQAGWEPERFLPEREMFKWWAGFNLRLATIGQSRLTEQQLTAALNALRPEGIWFAPPVDALEYGRELGFVADAWTPGFYVFPIAHLLAQVSPHFRQVSGAAFADFESPQVRRAAMQQRASEAVENLLSQCDQRTYRIIKSRESLPPNQRSLTLAELGKQLGCTRERVRQIESKFWKRIKHPQTKECSILIPALIAGLMQRRGSLVLDSGQWGNAIVRFLVKACGVPSSKMPFGNTRVLGVAEFESPAPGDFGAPAERIAPDRVAERLDAGSLSFLGRDDLELLAAAIAQSNLKNLNKQEKVYLTLREIGRPAHFSEISGAYNDIFPDDPMREHNVHAILSRCAAPDAELYGIVWVGVKGTYALKEHGYERPKLGIFEAVTKIVADKYAETGKSVHISVITTELGKYHQFINLSSLAYATGFNDRIEQVSKDYFIPKAAQPEVPAEDKSDEQSRKIREFWADHSNNP